MIKKSLLAGLVALLVMIFSSSMVHASASNLAHTISEISYLIVGTGGLLILLLIIWASLHPNPSEFFKTTVFISIVVAALAVTFYLAGATIYVNQNSETGGPVHWHADFRIFSCGVEKQMIEPSGLGNRIGRTDLHEHGDKRIHVEGVVVQKQDVSLSEFFRVIGGSLENGRISFPGREKHESFADGDKCADGQEGKLQVFLYKTEGKQITQTKLTDYFSYVLSDESKVPPGDCIIFEFGSEEKEQTDLICDFTSIAIQKGDYNYIK